MDFNISSAMRVSAFIVALTCLSACTSEYENVKACWSKNESSFQYCCDQYKVEKKKCDEYGSKRSQELADMMTGK